MNGQADSVRGDLLLKSVHSDRYNTFLKLVITARKNASLTQQGLADKLGRPQSYVSKYERGERRLDIIEFLEVAEILGIEPCKLLQKLIASPRRRDGGK